MKNKLKSIIEFEKLFVFPIIQSRASALSASDIIQVQSMTSSGKIFYLDYKYDTETKRIKIEKKVLTDPIEILMRKIGYDI